MDNDAERYLEYVEQDLVERHNIDETQAELMIDNLGLLKLIKEFPDQVMHQNVEYWSDWLVKQNGAV